MFKRHKMDFFIKSNELRAELRTNYPDGIYTLDLIHYGKRRATTRDHALGQVGERVILYNSLNPDCIEAIVEITEIEQLNIQTSEDAELWSQKEGWSVNYLLENQHLWNKWQTTFELVNHSNLQTGHTPNPTPVEGDKMSSKNEESLLEEYKSCDELVGRLDVLIWQMAALIFPITLAGLTYFGVSTNHTVDQFIILVVVGVGAVTLILTWYFLSRQWYAYQLLAFYRMREIESNLDLWHYRYAAFIRLPGKKRKLHLESISEDEKEKFQKIESAFGKFSHFGLHRSLAFITLIFVIGWMALVIREVILTFL